MAACSSSGSDDDGSDVCAMRCVVGSTVGFKYRLDDFVALQLPTRLPYLQVCVLSSVDLCLCTWS